MIKRVFFIVCVLSLSLWGCSHPLKSNLAQDYSERAPLKIVILPLGFSDNALEAIEEGGGGDAEDEAKIAKIRQVFDEVLRAKLAYMGYTLSPLQGDGLDLFDKERIEDIAERSFVDGVMVITITKWKAKPGALRTYLKIAVEGKLYSKDAELLWQASYKMKESAVSLDKKSRNISVIETFEPSLERAIEALFVRLPSLPAPEGGIDGGEKLFDWLR